MVKKNTTYSDDIEATFEDKISSKKANTIAGDIKKLQGNFLPNTQFKENLLQRLEGIYRVDALIDTPVNFSFFRVFSTVFSFVLMFAVVFIVYDSQRVDIYEENMILESDLSNGIPEGVGHKDQIGEQEDTLDQGEAAIQISPNDFTPITREQLHSDNDIEQTSDIQETKEEISQDPQFTESVEFTIEKESSQPQQTPLQHSEIRDTREGQQDSMSPEVIDTATEENIDTESYQSVSGESQDTQADQQQESIPMTMDMQDSDTPNEEDFSSTCEMYEGEYNPDMQTCLFSDGTICTAENIHTCAPQ